MKYEVRKFLARWYTAWRRYMDDVEFRENVSREFEKWLAENKWPLLICAVLATTIYGSIHQKREDISNRFDLRAEVVVTGVPSDVSVGVRPSTVKVTFRGTREQQLQQLTSGIPPKVEIPYPRKQIAKTGLASTNSDKSTQVPISAKNVKAGGLEGFGSANVVECDTKSVLVFYDTTDTRVLQIEPPALFGSPYKGRATVDFSPKETKVQGGRSKLDDFENFGRRMRLPPISVEGRAKSFSQELTILPPEGDESGIQIVGTEKVNASITITPFRVEKALKAIPVRLALCDGGSVLPGYEISPPSVNVTLVCDEDVVGRISTSNVAVYAECDAMAISSTNAVELAVSVRVPADASVNSVRVDPETVRFIPGRPLVEPNHPEPEPAVSMPAAPDAAGNAGAESSAPDSASADGGAAGVVVPEAPASDGGAASDAGSAAIAVEKN